MTNELVSKSYTVIKSLTIEELKKNKENIEFPMSIRTRDVPHTSQMSHSIPLSDRELAAKRAGSYSVQLFTFEAKVTGKWGREAQSDHITGPFSLTCSITFLPWPGGFLSIEDSFQALS